MITEYNLDELCLTGTWRKPDDYITLNESKIKPPQDCYKHEPHLKAKCCCNL